MDNYVPDIDERANWLSNLTYYYLSSILKLGNKKQLENNDLPEIGTRSSADFLSQRFLNAWNHESQKTARQPSIYKAMFKVVGREFIKHSFYALIGYEMMVLAPVILRFLIIWIDETALASSSNVDPPPIWQGYTFCGALILSQVVQVIFGNKSYESGMRVGTWMRTALTSAVFQKSLRLSSLARQNYNAGKIMNIMANDISRIDLVMQVIQFIWVGPLQLVSVFAVLIWLVGPSALVGLGIVLLCAPLQWWASKKMSKFRVKSNGYSDQRIKITQEVLLGVKVIKLYAWELSFLEELEQLRQKELKNIRFIHITRAISIGFLQTIPIMACVVNLIIYQLMGNTLTQSQAFTTLALYYVLRLPLLIYPVVVSMTVDAYLAFERIQGLLLAEELSNSPALTSSEPDEKDKTKDYAIYVEQSNFVWNAPVDIQDNSVSVGKKDAMDEQKPEENDENKNSNSSVFTGLKKIDFKVKHGSLVAVIGKVGSGKSSLLNAIIGEMTQTFGDSVKVNGTIAYCAQNAWIQNQTLKENILFGKEFNEELYGKTIEVCALESDLRMLAAGDETEIGEKGINLSGGQKQRVNIARAVYAETDIVLMDDPLSAVDAHVGTHIFNECILTALKGKTRVLVTHRLHVLSSVDYIYVIDNGEFVEAGTYNELMGKNGHLADLMKDIDTSEAKTTKDTEVVKKDAKPVAESTGNLDASKKKETAKLIVKEDRAAGQVTSKVYAGYIRLGGGWLIFTGLITLMSVAQASRIITDLWLNVWINKSVPGWKEWEYQVMYLGLGLIQTVLMIACGAAVVISAIRASRVVHSLALKKLLNCPMSWFDSQPLGRVINRFSRDLDTIDSMLVDVYRVVIYTFLMTFSIFILICIVFPIFLAPLLPVLVVYYFVQRYYRKTSIELKRLDNISRSPISAQFNEILTGSGQATIRAYEAQARFIKRNKVILDANNRSYYLSVIIQRWVSVRLEGLAILLILAVSLFGASFAKSISPGLVGLAITYSLQVTFIFNYCIKQFAEMEMHMSSVERLITYIDTLPDENESFPPSISDESEEKQENGDIQLQSIKTIPEESWPATGNVEVQDVVMRYREDLENVLKGVSFSIKSGEKVGIVGRTGAGKSSLIHAFFLLTPLRSGKIIIDGKDITSMPLHSLRKKISIIPQDPVIFSGKLRSNLDPFNQCTDEQLWNCLEIVGLKSSVDPEKGLDMHVAEGGENWSTGQRQLICLARAMLRKSRILILDEATASVDMNTDKSIQESLRKNFTGCTILTIAHRLETIMDYDKIVVMDAGLVKEFGSPDELVAAKGIFYSMAKEQDALKNSK